ncbi:alpha/beta hydrolase [Streptomyces halobius]|uniref:Alpha/beta hydrolase n=1 Tax=Streptomyces halobius TaxID=2879846 RepID=A0ABY4M5F2_9ACTN|nr:alpha/beta hydrolase [Streptomyces halobius]UQA91466.1 alpha/beta hydrolase [Streptomyces halobius]
MIIRRITAAVALLLAVVLAAFTWIIASFRIPPQLVRLSYVVSNFGLYLVPLGLLGVLLAVVLYRRGVRRIALVTGLVGVVATVAACFPLVAAWRSAERHGADLSLANYLTYGANTGEPDASKSVVYHRIDGQELKLDVKLPSDGPERARPAVVWVHGGGWVSGDRGEAPKWHKWLNDKGYAVFAIEYRLAPPPRWNQAPADVKCAIGWVRQHAETYGVDPDRIMTAGGSAGGNLALMGAYADDRVKPSCPVPDAADTPDTADAPVAAVAAVAAFYPATDVARGWQDTTMRDTIRKAAEDYTGGTPQQVPEHYKLASPVTYVRKDLPPTLLMHGTRDHVAPYQQSTGLAAKLREFDVPYRLLAVPYGEHAYDFRWGDWGSQVSRHVFSEFLDRYFPANPSNNG